jgi:hypothetical protein
MSLEEYFSTGPAHERPIFDAVIGHLDTIGPVHVEPVSVGIFLKRARTFAELRPMQRWVAVSFSLHHDVQHPLKTRKAIHYGGRVWITLNVRSPDALDDRIRDWLTEAYEDAPPA